jgi:hypothetical protein
LIHFYKRRMDLSSCAVKLDHSVGAPEALPNYRQVPGFPVYAVGQPLESGLASLADKLPKMKTIWFNVRREPVVYINGDPCAPREKNDLHYNIEVKNLKTADLQPFEDKCTAEFEAKVKDGSLEISKDKDFQENPMERENIINSVKVDSVKSFSAALAGVKMEDISVVRIPFEEERPLPEECFDLIVAQLAGESPSNTQCVFSSQKGQGRSTLGAVIACIVKATQMMEKLHKMVDEGMAETSWAEGIIKTKFEDLLASEDLKDPLLMGEFDVIKELLEKHPETKQGKVLADKMIDICGVAPEGTGLQNLRKCIIQTKYKYDAATEDKQVVWKRMIINFIERYFYLICFATYARANVKEGFKKSFTAWMEEHKELRGMVENGKDKLEWYRKVDEGKISNLKDMVQGDNYQEKLGSIVGALYKLAFQTYADIPRGPVKDNLMRKLACKTLMEILPQDVTSRVQKELEEKKLSIDFDTVMGLVVA